MTPSALEQPQNPVYLAVGKLRRPHGLHGEILMDVLTDFPERLRVGMHLYVGERHNPLKLRSKRWQEPAMLVAFDEYHTPEEVGELRNELVYTLSKQSPTLEEGEFYHHQVIGLRAVEETGRFLGTVSEVISTGANDVFVVKRDRGPDLLLPATDEVVRNIDLEKGEMLVHLLPGLEGE